MRTERDSGCQRGLHYRISFDAAVAPDPSDVVAIERLTEQLHAYDSRIVQSARPWGRVWMHHFVLPFRFELRVWTRPGELSFFHRATASESIRSRDRQAIEQLLEDWVAGCRPACGQSGGMGEDS